MPTCAMCMCFIALMVISKQNGQDLAQVWGAEAADLMVGLVLHNSRLAALS